MHAAPTRTRFQRAHGVNAHGTGIHDANAPGSAAHTAPAHAASTCPAPARTRCQRTQHRHTRCQRTNRPRPHAILSHQDPYARTLSARKRPSPPSEVIIKRLGNEGYERLKDMNDCFFWTPNLLSSPQVNGMTKTEDMNDSFISSASGREIVHNLRPFIPSNRSYPPTVHILTIGQIRTHALGLLRCAVGAPYVRRRGSLGAPSDLLKRAVKSP